MPNGAQRSRQQTQDDAEAQPVVPERRCERCGVKLSNYNPGPNCWQHTIGYPWRGPTAKPKFPG